MIKIVAYTVETIGNEILIQDSEGESVQSSNVKDLIFFLNEPFKEYLAIKVFWDLDTALAPILRKLGASACKQLASSSHTYNNLFYIPSKLFRIEGDGHLSFFYHLSQYYIDDDEPHDPETIAGMAQNVMEAFKAMGLNPKKLTSPVAIYESEVMSHMNIPTIMNIPGQHEEIIEYSEHCLGVPDRLHFWIQAYQVGHWLEGDIFEYDLRCYSDDTECLTINGWKYIKDLSKGELIMGFNPSNNVCQFQPVLDINIKHYEGNMVHITNRNADLLLTPNHRVLMKDKIRCKRSLYYQINGSYAYKDWTICEAGNLPNGNFRIPVSYPIEDRPELNISDDLLNIIAWINTEGTKVNNWEYRRYYFSSINISQSPSANPDKCKCLLDTMVNSGLHFRKWARTRQYTHDKSKTYEEMIISIPKSVTTNLSLDEVNIHLIPLWILHNCSLRQLKLYFETLIAGDGSRSYKKGNLVKTSFYTILEENKDRMMYLCHLLGYKVTCRPPDKHHTTYQIFINETKTDYKIAGNPNNTGISYNTINFKEYYSGNVVCPTIDDGYLVVRRNNKSCICGNSAYPSIAVTLPSLQYAKYAKARTTKFQYSMNYDKLGGEPDWGFMKGIVTIDEGVKVSPIFDDEGKQRTGRFPAYITWHDYQFIKKWGIGDFKIDDGYFLKFTSHVYPMEQPLKRLFNQRGFGSMTDTISKRISTAFGFGKWLERHDDGSVGNYYNPPYACMVVSLNNLKVADFIYKNKLQDDLVHVGVDSVSSTKEAKVGDQMRIGMGDWRFSGIGAMLVLSSGRVYHGDKKPQGLNYTQIVDLINQHPYSTHYTANLYRRQTLEESIQLDNLNGLGRMKQTASSFDINLLRTATERQFDTFPKNGHELLHGQYRSTPLHTKELLEINA
jgi:hypothetical protein